MEILYSKRKLWRISVDQLPLVPSEILDAMLALAVQVTPHTGRWVTTIAMTIITTTNTVAVTVDQPTHIHQEDPTANLAEATMAVEAQAVEAEVEWAPEEVGDKT